MRRVLTGLLCYRHMQRPGQLFLRRDAGRSGCCRRALLAQVHGDATLRLHWGEHVILMQRLKGHGIIGYAGITINQCAVNIVVVTAAIEVQLADKADKINVSFKDELCRLTSLSHAIVCLAHDCNIHPLPTCLLRLC